MFVDGHLELLDRVLENIEFKNINKKTLRVGAVYPDLPCGKYLVRNNNVIFKNEKLCETIKLSKLLFEVDNGEKNIFQFHRGFFAHLHAMTTDPDNNVLKIRNKILTSIMGYALLSVYNNTLFDKTPKISPNIFWIGIIFHTITDSYSGSHTIRGYKTKTKYVKSPIIDYLKKNRLDIHEKIKMLAKEDKLYSDKEFINKLIEELKDNSDSSYGKYDNNHGYVYKKNYIKTHKKMITKIYKVFKFEYNTNKKVEKYSEKFKKMLLTGHSGKQRDGDIIGFQYFANQPHLMHPRLDLLKNILNNELLYNKLIKECVAVFALYKIVLHDKDVNKFIKNIFLLMYNETFRIHNKYLHKKTDKIADDSNYKGLLQTIMDFLNKFA